MNYIESYYIGAYWGPREESLDICTKKVIDFFSILSEMDSSFEKWFEKGYSRKKALEHQYIFEYDKINKSLLNSRIKTDIGNIIMENLGYSFSTWNGLREGEITGISIHCNTSSNCVSNNVVIKLPSNKEVYDDIYKIDFILRMFNLLIELWHPEQVVMTSSQLRDSVSINDNAPLIGWITYLNTQKKLEKLLNFCRMDYLKDGVILIVGDKCPTINDKKQVDNIKKIQSIINHERL